MRLVFFKKNLKLKNFYYLRVKKMVFFNIETPSNNECLKGR